MCKTSQKIYQITNTVNNKFVVTSSFLSLRRFTDWMTHLIRSGVSLNCPVFRYCKRYRNGLNVTKVDKIEDASNYSEIEEALTNLRDAIIIDEGLIPWIESSDDYVPPANHVAPFINNHMILYASDYGIPFVPSDLVLYNEDDEIIIYETRYRGYYDEIQEQKLHDRTALMILKSQLNLYHAIFNPNTEDEDELGDDSDNEPDEPVEPVIHRVGFCNICYTEDANLLKTPECDCVGDNDFTFLCTGCLPNIHKCPQCRQDY